MGWRSGGTARDDVPEPAWALIDAPAHVTPRQREVLVLREDRAARAHGLAGFPMHVAIDGSSAVVDYSAGDLGDDGLDAFVRELGIGG